MRKNCFLFIAKVGIKKIILTQLIIFFCLKAPLSRENSIEKHIITDQTTFEKSNPPLSRTHNIKQEEIRAYLKTLHNSKSIPASRDEDSANNQKDYSQTTSNFLSEISITLSDESNENSQKTSSPLPEIFPPLKRQQAMSSEKILMHLHAKTQSN